MNETKNLVLAIALSIIVILGWEYYNFNNRVVSSAAQQNKENYIAQDQDIALQKQKSEV